MRKADIVVAAAGVPGIITGDMVKPGAAVLDVGVSRVDGKIAGDVADDVWDVAGWVSPNPGGVGPMTRAMLLSNIVAMAEKSGGVTEPRAARRTSLDPVRRGAGPAEPATTSRAATRRRSAARSTSWCSRWSAIAIGIVATGDWRLGVRWFGGALLFAAAGPRRCCRPRTPACSPYASRWWDCVLLAGAGAALIFLAGSIPDQPPLTRRVGASRPRDQGKTAPTRASAAPTRLRSGRAP